MGQGAIEGQAGGWAGHQASILKVWLGLGEIEGRDGDRDTQRDKETKRHRDKADSKNPPQGRVAQLVEY